MHNWDNEKRIKYDNMFFVLKILALFFCSAPLFLHYFSDNTSNIWSKINSKSSVLFLVIIAVIAFMWFMINFKLHRTLLSSFLEISILYISCLASILYSGVYTSYYKYMFIFMIVVYTIDYGTRIGLVIASSSAATIFVLDLVFYDGTGVNPYFQSDIALAAMFFIIAWVLGSYAKMESDHIEYLKNYANIDGLTGTYNHRYFFDVITSLFEKCEETGEPLSLIMIDIDYFKVYNDLYGHQSGDTVLTEISKIILQSVGSNAVVCRYGGEEFTVIFPGLSQDNAKVIADKLRQTVCDFEFYGQDYMPNGNLTVSIGVAERRPENDTVIHLIDRADMALYRAKFLRKNRTELYYSIFDQFSNVDVKADESIISVKSLITIINSRDHYTYNHTERVASYCELFADYISLAPEDKKTLIYSAYLHDIGKINIEKETLISERPFTFEEWSEIRKHPVDGAEIIKQLHLDDIAEIVLQHHEHYDGSGYPNGLTGENINRLARILTIADSFDAMTAKRPYRKPFSFSQACDELLACRGTHFDPELAVLFVQAIKDTGNFNID